MRSVIALLLTIAVVACTAAPLLYANNANAINGSYIVVLKKPTSFKARDSHVSSLRSAIKEVNDESTIDFVYGSSSFVGFAGHLSEKFLQAELNHPEVLYIEADQMMTASYLTQPRATWGLGRISSRDAGVADYFYNSSIGKGVDVFVIDTGIYTDNVDFEGRATSVFTAFPNEPDYDENGHGTHCAGTIGGKTYGVAKGVTLKAVKVLNKSGSGSNAGVIAGVNYVTQNRVKGRPTVASMSLGGGKSTALDSAVEASINSGVVYSVAAGNENRNACLGSPAAVPTAITVGATDSDDNRAYFSNFGSCVDIFAPGVDITSDWLGKKGTNTISGTSMACPHVSGVLALHLSSFPKLSPADASDWLVNKTGSVGKVGDPGIKSPNVLLFSPPV